MKLKESKYLLQYIIYILRWIVFAIPGAWFLIQVQKIFPEPYTSMIISQGILGALIFFIDKQIFLKGEKII